MAKVNDKKIAKKVAKFLGSLAREPNEYFTCVSSPTSVVCLVNAGLTTSVTREEVISLFSPFGTIKDVWMLQGKSYSLVSFVDTSSAVQCYESLNGNMCLQLGKQPLYMCFVNNVNEALIGKSNTDGEWPSGLILEKDFVSSEEECTLIEMIQFENDEGSQLKHRTVKHYGYAFQYDSTSIDKQNPLSQGIPSEMHSICEKFVKLGAPFPDQLTVNRYLPGQGIPPHVDTHNSFEDGIVVVSLGSMCTMDFRHPDGRHLTLTVPQRSCLIMTGEARYLWSHGITPRKNDVVRTEDGGLTLVARGIRTSLTFRKVRAGDCECIYPDQCDSPSRKADACLEDLADNLEKKHVFAVYNNIAAHFSDTRHKPWPNVLEFVNSFPIGSLLVDVGCGNGKYLEYNKDAYKIGCDRSRKLLEVCRERGYQAVNADCRCSPLRDGVADGVICIAVIHHLATEDRRLHAIQDIFRLLRVGGRALIYVWAKDQEREMKKSTYLLQSRKKSSEQSSSAAPKCDLDPEYNLPVHDNRTDFKHSDVLVPWKLNPKSPSLQNASAETSEVFLRYYHVFLEGELEKLCRRIENLNVCRTYYDQGNWCIIFEKAKM